jgi:hypothetical protein
MRVREELDVWVVRFFTLLIEIFLYREEVVEDEPTGASDAP